jgi:hypothetical protein
MRLTLRTLLAYLDGNLEPDDAEDIGRKIEESEFPQKLVQLIRECTLRPRLGAPPLTGRGLGADPNTVAEYLEYRLGDDRVPEFERICLDSEIHLAEVASCHQILTLVLGEPAEIDPHSRERMYALAAQADAPPLQTDSIRQAVSAPVSASNAVASGNAIAATSSVSPGAAPSAIPPVVRRPRPEVPEYLRENRWPIWPVVAMVLVAASLTISGLFFFGPTPFRQQVTALMATPSAGTSENSSPAEPAVGETDPATATEATPTGSAPTEQPAVDPTGQQAETMPSESDAVESTPEATTTPETPQPEATASESEPAPLQPDEPVATDNPDAGDSTLASPAAEMPAEGDPATAPVPPEPGAVTPGIGEPGVTARSVAPQPLPTIRSKTPAEPDGEMPAEPQPLAGTPSNDANTPGTPPDAARRLPAEGFGRYILSAADILLSFDPASGDWMRLPAQAPLNKGQRLLSLPLFQPAISLSAGITIQADAPADFELVGWDDAGLPILAVQYGRMLMSTVGKAGNGLRLQIDGQEPVLTFVDSESTLAIEVRRDLPLGKNPESGAAPLTATIYAVSGMIRVAKQDGAPVELQAPAVMSLSGNAEQQPGASQFPQWVNQDQSKANDSAANEIQAYIAPDKPTAMQLRELLDPQNKLYKKREVRTLAVRCLANLGDFEPSITALNDIDLGQYWHEVRHELQAAIARSPESAARVRAAFVKQRGDTDGKALYRMLWGYNTSDLQTGSDRDLVDALARNDSLDFRVLGILTLKELQGGANHGYRPDDTEFKRRIPLNYWKGRVGKLVPRVGGAAAKGRPTATPAE